MKNFPKIKGIIRARVYSFADIASTLGVHIRTVQTWRRTGLTVADEQSRPYLVTGKDLITFLDDRQSRRRCSLGPDELYCLACKVPRQAASGTISMKLTGRVLGNGEPQMLISGRCPICGRKMSKLVKATDINKGDDNETGKE